MRYVAFILFAMLGVSTGPEVAYAQTPFSCDGAIYQVQSGRLRRFDPITSTYTNVGPVQTAYNAIGYSAADNFIYGVQGNRIIRVDATGAVAVIWSPNISSNSGDMDDNDNLWIQRSTTQVTRFNVLTGVQSTFTLTGGVFPQGSVDFAFVTTPLGDRIVAVGNTQLALVDPTTGVTVNRTVTSLPGGDASGATWGDSTGRVFTFRNGSGNVYEIKDYLTANPFAVQVATGTPSTSNDGASCRAQPFPNLAPIARADSFTTPFQTGVSGNVLADNGAGVDNDPEGTALTVQTTPVVNPSNGSVIILANGNFTYTPNAGFSGTDTFQYMITDAAGLSATAVVTITVTKAVLTVTKSGSVYLPTAFSQLAIPGNDFVYAIEVTNTGNQAADTDSIFIVDRLPSQVTFWNGDINSGGPATYAGTDPVAWLNGSSGLTFLYGNDVRYSNLAANPANFAACTYTPVTGYDAAVVYICINPKGAMLPAGGRATFYFRTRIN
jgi:hypothetical protein